MRAQLTSRVVKLVSSLLIMVTLTIAAIASDEVVVATADATGSVLVSGVIIVNALRILQGAVPDLLDRSACAAVQASIERTLERHRDAYAALRRVRSRRSGHVVFVEIALSFAGGLSHAEVERHTALLRASLREEIEGHLAKAGLAKSGAIRVLTMPRILGLARSIRSLVANG